LIDFNGLISTVENLGLFAGALVGIYAIAGEIAGYIISKSKYGMNGEWEQIIPAQNGDPRRIDLVRCKHSGENVSGVIQRLDPPPEPGERRKQWNFQGKKKDMFVFLIYWTRERRLSYGTIQLLDFTTKLSGNYVKLVPDNTSHPTKLLPKLFDIEWRKMSTNEIQQAHRALKGSRAFNLKSTNSTETVSK
jgi:hypothetical protein